LIRLGLPRLTFPLPMGKRISISMGYHKAVLEPAIKSTTSIH
jgi:hypothetical protein